MRILIACSYYSPYVSGVTEYARLLAEGLACRGHKLTIATTRHIGSLPAVESIRDVTVYRSWAPARVGRAPVSPLYAWMTSRLAQSTDVVNVHLPMADGLILGRMLRKRNLVATYHCDVASGRSIVEKIQARAVDAASKAVLERSEAIAISTLDYARSSRLLADRISRCHEIPPPAKPPSAAAGRFHDGNPTIGFCGRIVAEKGIDHLLMALPLVRDKFPRTRLLLVGDWLNVAGRSDMNRIRHLIPDDGSVVLTGGLSEDDLWSFYRSLDVFVLPSVNSFEAFGMVQIEAMMCGVPVVVSNLPGVRRPVAETGMGIVVPVADHRSLAAAIVEVLTNPSKYKAVDGKVEALYGREKVIDAYEELFVSVSS